MESKVGECGKDSPCNGRQGDLITVGSRVEFDPKVLELGQFDQARGHRLGWNETSWECVVKYELDEVTS